MISTLSKFDAVTAAGILARAALALTDSGNPVAAETVVDEADIRRRIVSEIKARLGVDPADESEETRILVGEQLDEESDQLLGPTDDTMALTHLSERGELPGDLYDVEILPYIAEIHGKYFADERKLVEATVHAADREEHFGMPESAGDGVLMSLFAKVFASVYERKTFMMLVVGRRRGLVFEVHQAWRIYAKTDALNLTAPLIGILRAFSERFGAPVECEGKTGSFILLDEVEVGRPITTTFQTRPKLDKTGRPIGVERYVMSQFMQMRKDGKGIRGAVVNRINLEAYNEFLYGVR